MRLSLTGKAILIVWLLIMMAIALYPPRKFAFAGVYDYGGDRRDRPTAYLGRSPERFDPSGKMDESGQRRRPSERWEDIVSSRIDNGPEANGRSPQRLAGQWTAKRHEE